ncbi:MAG: hypothetical protein Q7R79_04660 [bacterium]|nr:hypothetical protein [bacterium]
MTDLPKIYHSVEVYLFDNKFYVIPRAAVPPIFLWAAVEPIIEVTDYESKTLARALESAKEASKLHVDPAHPDSSIKPLEARKKEVRQILNQSTKQWSLLWKENGVIELETLTPDKTYRGTMQWKILSKKTFNLDAFLEDIAKEILSERVQTPNKENLPDIPMLVDSFGYKMAWLAIKNTTPEEIVQKLQLPGVHVIDWYEGLKKVYEYHANNTILLSPQIKGWSFVVGWYVGDFHKPDGKLEWLKERMIELSSIFDEVQAFGTHRVSEYHHWILAKNGKIERCFAYGDSVLYNEGKLTEAEKMFPWERLADYQSALKPWFPDEDDVMTLAGKWSVNPQTIEGADVNGKSCYITNIPSL